jgi:hypothetical protein
MAFSRNGSPERLPQLSDTSMALARYPSLARTLQKIHALWSSVASSLGRNIAPHFGKLM